MVQWLKRSPRRFFLRQVLKLQIPKICVLCMGTRFMYVGKEILIVRELSFTKKIENWEEGLEEIL